MKGKLLLFCLFIGMIVQNVVASADTLSVAALMGALDEVVSAHERYVAVRESRIARLKRQLADTDTASTAFFDGMGKYIRNTRRMSAIRPSII